MTAEEINRSVIQDSGRTDLAEDYAADDFAPTGRALELMNEAQQFLDRLYRNRGTEKSYTFDIGEGDYLLAVPSLRHITRVDMLSPDGIRHELRRRSPAFLREHYNEPFGSVAHGEPQDWSPTRGDTISEAEIISNGEFTTDLTGWTAGSGWTWAAGKASFSYPGIGTSISQAFTEQSLTNFTLRFDATVSTGATLTVAMWAETGFPSPIDVDLVSITESGSYSIPLGGLLRAGLAFRCSSVGAAVTLDNVSISVLNDASLITMPPADAAYTVTVHGGYHTSAFEAASDISWWSDTHPSILMMAYRMVIERHFHANETRVSYWMKQIALEAKQLQIDLVAEDTANPPKYMRRMPSAVARRHLT
jgi:hypothetical protein